MTKHRFYIFLLTITFTTVHFTLRAQKTITTQDTFFLAKKKGLLGRFGKSISHTIAPDEAPEKLENSLLKFKGKIIRSIILEQFDFGCSIYDTCDIKKTFGTEIANKLHKNSSPQVIRNNLFFREGDKLFPYLVADNERYLRDLVYINDARILVEFAENSTDSVDVVVLTKDLFSIGAKLVIYSKTRGRVETKEENILGSGNKIMLSGYFDDIRSPKKGFGAEFIRRNVRGSFIDWTSGYQNYRSSISSGRNEETAIYTRLEKPLVTPYIPTTGAVEWGYYKTHNDYVSDSFYKKYIKYEYYNIDGWIGYSLDNSRSLYASKEIKVHRFIAVRGFNQRFLSVPLIFIDSFDYRFTDFTGALVSMNVFKQSFYKTSFIYGFGRNEDIPEGFSIAATGGYVNKESIKRPYAGLDVQLNNIKKKGVYNNYTFRAGSYFWKGHFEDIDLLFSIEHFTSLKKMKGSWYRRIFINSSITAQANPRLNAPLFLNSDYGLTYFDNIPLMADLRATVKAETVFYNTKKILGFRFAPFVFADASMVKPVKMGIDKMDLFSAWGGGVRTRNENLVFGTIELKGYYFPRTYGNMKNWKIEVTSNVRFKYKSSFIRRPDFIIAN